MLCSSVLICTLKKIKNSLKNRKYEVLFDFPGQGDESGNATCWQQSPVPSLPARQSTVYCMAFGFTMTIFSTKVGTRGTGWVSQCWAK